MARRPKIYHREPKEWFPCPVHDCPRKLRTQTGRTKHIRSKHENIDLQTQTPSQNSLSLEIPPERLSPIDTNYPIDLDPQDVDSCMSNVPCTPHHCDGVASDVGFMDGTNMTHSPLPTHLSNDNDPSSPPPFQSEVEVHNQTFASTDYHPFINGMS